MKNKKLLKFKSGENKFVDVTLISKLKINTVFIYYSKKTLIISFKSNKKM